ncbi:Serine protease gd [Camponotus japonicus]
MAKVPILIVLLPQLLCTLLEVSGQQSPCYEYFTYIFDPATRQVMGQIQIPSAPKNVELHLKVTLSIAIELPTNYVGLLKVVQSKEEFVRMDQRDKPLLYHIHFPLLEPIPLLTGISFNHQQYCSGPHATGEVVTSITLDHTLYRSSVLPHSQNSSDSSQQNLSTSIQPNNSLSTPQPTDPVYTSTLHTPVQSSECGISSLPITDNSLTSKKIKTSPGQWPWLVAIHHFSDGNYIFLCVGSILTKKHVITAARCLKMMTDTLMAISFGQYRLTRDKIGFLKREIASYTLHPDYNSSSDSGDSDLAILTLKTPVDFSPTIKPICMWHGSIDLQSVNMTGYIVWWNKLNNQGPRMIKAPIVSQETCLENIGSPSSTTSNRIFCAGIRDDIRTCILGIGSGLMLYDPITQRYQLRGIFSRMIFQFNDGPTCQYIVFADVAKHLSWIYQQISTEQ